MALFLLAPPMLMPPNTFFATKSIRIQRERVGLRLSFLAATLFAFRLCRRRRFYLPPPALAGLDGLSTQSVLRVIAASELGGNEIQRQVARIDVVFRATVVAGIDVTADDDAASATTAGPIRIEVLRHAQVVLEGLLWVKRMFLECLKLNDARHILTGDIGKLGGVARAASLNAINRL